MRNFAKILLLGTLAVVLVGSCSRAKVIRKKDFKNIYAEMFLADQMLMTAKGGSRLADTSLVYESIFRKYGYTREDYQKSIEVYMEDPMIFTRTIKQAGLIIDKKIKALEKEKKVQDALEAERKRQEEALLKEQQRKEEEQRQRSEMLDSLFNNSSIGTTEKGFLNVGGGGFSLPKATFTMVGGHSEPKDTTRHSEAEGEESFEKPDSSLHSVSHQNDTINIPKDTTTVSPHSNEKENKIKTIEL